jgi:hypothetical protein
LPHQPDSTMTDADLREIPAEVRDGMRIGDAHCNE